MSNLTVVTSKPRTTFLAKAAAATSMVLLSASSFAAAGDIDVTDVATSLSALIIPIGVVGAAYLGVRVAVRGWKIIRGVV